MKNRCLSSIVFLFIFFSTPSYSIADYRHTSPASKYEYFIFISGADKREDVLYLQELIQKKAGVTYFMADRFPVRCFILRSSRHISAEEFKKWIGDKYKLSSYGEGDIAKEKAYAIYNQQKKSIHK